MIDFDDDTLGPQRCPICQQPNRYEDGGCEHHWGVIYDWEMTEGPYATEFEMLWTHLYDACDVADESLSNRYLKLLRDEGLDDLADAVLGEDKFWWLTDVPDKARIEPEDHPASGSGWVLYHRESEWFERILHRMRRAAALAKGISQDLP